MTEPHIQLLDDLGAEFDRVAREHERRRRPAQLRSLAVALGIVVLLAAGAYAVPPTRAALDDLTSAFSAWLGDDEGAAPGRALRPDDDVPRWVTDTDDVRVVAEAAGVQLYATRQDDMLGFWLGEGMGMMDSVEGWRERFDDHAVVVLGPALFGRGDELDERGRYPLLGVTARSVDRIELRYREGPPLVATGVDGGFVLLADAWRRHDELVAYDDAGRELERASLAGFDQRYLCDKDPTCPASPVPDPSPEGGLVYLRIREAFQDYRGWVPVETEHWAARDGTGRLRTVQFRPGDDPVDPGDPDRWQHRVRSSDERFGTGDLASQRNDGCLPPTNELPADPGRLARVFDAARTQCAGDVPPAAKSFEDAVPVLMEPGPSPQLRAALYEIITGIDGVELDGDAHDPLGRPATAVALDVDYGGRPVRNTLYLEPGTSQPLAYTERLREPQDWIDGLLLRYQVVVETGRVESADARP